jgi:hypothetical protein
LFYRTHHPQMDSYEKGNVHLPKIKKQSHYSNMQNKNKCVAGVSYCYRTDCLITLISYIHLRYNVSAHVLPDASLG